MKKLVIFWSVQSPFPTVKTPKEHRPVIGSALTLQCYPPEGYPKGVVYWGEKKPGFKLRPIENTGRISLDYDGEISYQFVKTSIIVTCQRSDNHVKVPCCVLNLLTKNTSND